MGTRLRKNWSDSLLSKESQRPAVAPGFAERQRGALGPCPAETSPPSSSAPNLWSADSARGTGFEISCCQRQLATWQLLLQRGLFHLRSLSELLFTTPPLAHSAQRQRRDSGHEAGVPLNVGVGLRTTTRGLPRPRQSPPRVGSHFKHFSKSEFGRNCDAAHLTGCDQLTIETDKLVAGNRNSEIYNVQSVQKVGP